MDSVKSLIKDCILEWVRSNNPEDITDLVDVLYDKLDEVCTDLTLVDNYHSTCAYCGRPAESMYDG